MFFKKRAKNSAAGLSVPAVQAEPSFIGQDAAIDGQVSCDGELHIDGAFRGTVRARVCVVDLNGVVQGDISGDVIHVRGRVIGPIQGAKVYIHAGAHVEGDVFHDTISIENGAYVYGTIRHNATPVPAPQVFPTLSASLPETMTGASSTDSDDDEDGEEGPPIRVVHSRK